MLISIGCFILFIIYFIQYMNFVYDKMQKVEYISQIHVFLIACVLSLPAFNIEGICFTFEIYFIMMTTFIRMGIYLWEKFQYVVYTKKKSLILFLLIPLCFSILTTTYESRNSILSQQSLTIIKKS